MNRQTLAIRLLVVATIWTLLHAYVWQRLFSMMQGPAESAAAMLTLALLPFGALFTARREQMPMTAAMVWLGFTALALSSLLMVLVLITDVFFVRVWVDARTITTM